MKSLTIAFALLLTLNTVGFAQQEPSPSSKVVFVRTFNVLGWCIGYDVFKGESTKLTRIKPQTVAVIDIPAEPTQVWAKTEVKRSVDLNLQAKEIYFVECSVGFGGLLAHPQLKLISLVEFQRLYSRKRYVRRQLQKQGHDSVKELVKDAQNQVAIN